MTNPAGRGEERFKEFPIAQKGIQGVLEI